MVDPADLVGTWLLADFVITFSDGRAPVHPLGADARGQIVYAADGRMMAVLSRADRAPLGVSRLEARAQATAAAKAVAFDSYVSYAGTWRVDGDEVVHHVELALVPELVGVDNRRVARLDGDTLVLSYAVTARSGVERRYALRWARPPAG